MFFCISNANCTWFVVGKAGTVCGLVLVNEADLSQVIFRHKNGKLVISKNVTKSKKVLEGSKNGYTPIRDEIDCARALYRSNIQMMKMMLMQQRAYGFLVSLLTKRMHKNVLVKQNVASQTISEALMLYV